MTHKLFFYIYMYILTRDNAQIWEFSVLEVEE